MKTPHQEKQQQFLEIYEAFNSEIFRFCLSKTRNRDVSLDITQEVFIKTWDYLRSGKKIDMVRGFLYKVARNLIIDLSRKKQPLSLDVLTEKNDTPLPADLSTYGSSESRINHRIILKHLEQLPEHHYEILVLRFIQELTLQEIAKLYKESENTVSVRIHRAIKMAQKLFPEEFYEEPI